MNGRATLAGQQRPAHLSDLAVAMETANAAARQSSGEFNDHPTDETLAQMQEDELAAEDAERAYLEALADWRDSQTWAGENAIEQQLDHFSMEA